MMEVAIRMLLGAIFLWLGGGVIDYRYDLLGWRRRSLTFSACVSRDPDLGLFSCPFTTITDIRRIIVKIITRRIATKFTPNPDFRRARGGSEKPVIARNVTPVCPPRKDAKILGSPYSSEGACMPDVLKLPSPTPLTSCTEDEILSRDNIR